MLPKNLPPESGASSAGENGSVSGEPEERILGLIPAYNEESRVVDVVAATRIHLPVLVVDDGSRDETATRARAAGAEVLIQRPNQGKGAALRAGFRWALDRQFGAVVTLDADGQHDPAQIPQFLAAYEQTGADLIIGARDFSQMPPVRRLANSLGRLAFSWAVGQPIEDNQSGYRLISRRLLHAILDSKQAGFEYEVEMIVTCVRLDYRLAWTPVRTIYAGESSHIRPVEHTLNFLSLVLRTRRAMRQTSQAK